MIGLANFLVDRCISYVFTLKPNASSDDHDTHDTYMGEPHWERNTQDNVDVVSWHNNPHDQEGPRRVVWWLGVDNEPARLGSSEFELAR
jgi:hypothetical protein